MNLWSEAEEHEDLGDPGTGKTLATGNLGLAGDRAGNKFLPPRDGLAERLDDKRGPGLPGRLRWLECVPGWRNGTDHAACRHLGRQDADIAVLERPVRPQGNLDGLFAEFDATFDVVGRYVDNAKPDFRDDSTELIEGNPGSPTGLEPAA